MVSASDPAPIAYQAIRAGKTDHFHVLGRDGNKYWAISSPHEGQKELYRGRAMVDLSNDGVTVHSFGGTPLSGLYAVVGPLGPSLAEEIKGRALTPRQALNFTYSIAQAVAYLHGKGVRKHSLDPKEMIYANRMASGKLYDARKATKVTPIPRHSAPEIELAGAYDTTSSVYSLAAAMHTALLPPGQRKTRAQITKRANEGRDVDDLLAQIAENPTRVVKRGLASRFLTPQDMQSLPNQGKLSTPLHEILGSMLEVRTGDRPTPQEVAEHLKPHVHW